MATIRVERDLADLAGMAWVHRTDLRSGEWIPEVDIASAVTGGDHRSIGAERHGSHDVVVSGVARGEGPGPRPAREVPDLHRGIPTRRGQERAVGAEGDALDRERFPRCVGPVRFRESSTRAPGVAVSQIEIVPSWAATAALGATGL